MRERTAGLRRAIVSLAATDALTIRQVALLLILHDGSSEGTVAGCAGAMRIAKSAVTKSMNKLETRGLARRERSRDDGRVVFMRVTSKGQRRVEALHAAMMGPSRLT